MPSVRAHGVVFLNPDVLRVRPRGRSPKRVFDQGRIEAFEKAILKFQGMVIVLNGKRRDEEAVASLKASLSPKVAALVVNWVDISRRGRFAKENRLIDWYRNHCSPDVPFAAIEPDRKGYSKRMSILECKGGFDSKAGNHLETMLVWGPSHERSYPFDMLNWQGWLSVARRLLESARLIEPHFRDAAAAVKKWLDESGKTRPIPNFDMGYSYLLLAGYALENILKAALILSEGPELRRKYQQTGSLPRDLKQHDLYALATRLGVTLSLEEESLVRRITLLVEWYSRYPLPTDPGGFFVKFSDGMYYSPRSLGPGDMDNFESFVERLVSTLGFEGCKLEKPRSEPTPSPAP